MRMAIFSDTCFPQVNGVSKYLEEMQRYMDKNNILYQLFLPPTNRDRINITTFSGRPFGLYPELQICWPSNGKINEVLDKFNPDLVCLVTPLSIGWAGLKYARRRKIPVVAAYHTNIPQYLSYYRLGAMRGTVWKYLKWFHSFSSINFCPSLDTMEQLLLHGIGNISISNNGVDTASFTPEKYNEYIRQQYAPPGDLLLLYVGRLAPEKGLFSLMKAAELLNEAQLNYKLLVVGDGPDRTALQDQAPANVLFAGYKSGIELQQIYASADIFIFPSATETFGNVVLEAMASGLPVVGAYRGGVTESLRDGFNGLAFNPDDTLAIAHNILRLANDSNLYNELSQNAREFALTRTWDIIFNEFFASCNRLISTQSSAALRGNIA